jgi:hypothetical protein
MDSLFDLLLAAAGAYFIYFMYKNKNKKQKDRGREFARLLGHNDERLIHVSGESVTGIGINTKTRTLVFMDENKIKGYPFEQIDSWRIVWPTGRAGMGEIEDKMRRGLFITVKGDLDSMQWKIIFGDEANINKWSSILDQALYDGVQF